MDGLRGFLAFAVVFHHAAIYHGYLMDGVWKTPPSHVFALLGPVGVDLFFMITGFLFWGQMMRVEGRPSWIALYLGRVFRIGPLYLFAVTILFLIVAVQTRFTLQEPVTRLVRHGLTWLALGLPKTTDTMINAYQHTNIPLAGVTWTLSWEWRFYLSLPFLALAARTTKRSLIVVLLSLVLCELGVRLLHWDGEVITYVVLFLLGMLCACLQRLGWTGRLPQAAGSSIIAILAVAVFLFPHLGANPLGQLALGIIFYLIVSGGDLFGLLRTRAAVRLGNVSYGIYLLQGLALGCVFQWPGLRQYEVHSPLVHWAMSLLAATLLLCLATATHVWIERPGIEVGRRLAKRYKHTRARAGGPLKATGN